MTRSQWIVVALGFMLLALHGVFPPRANKKSGEPTDRAFFASTNFYETDIRVIPKHELSPGFDSGVASNSAVLAYDRFIMISLIIFALSGFLIGILGALAHRGLKPGV